MSASWFEDQPSEAYKARVARLADREIETGAQTSRRNVFAEFFNSWRDVTLTAGWASGIAAIAAVWLVSRNELQSRDKQVAEGPALGEQEMEFDLQNVSVDDFNLVTDLELYENLDFLDAISDEELERGEADS